ncbi:hypothetical protein ANAPC5_01483 [Anaplasma phagocytophilum]|nr:hypothetical protein ANAPC5_01483 [Anaplasma phagocytophilum]
MNFLNVSVMFYVLQIKTPIACVKKCSKLRRDPFGKLPKLRVVSIYLKPLCTFVRKRICLFVVFFSTPVI